MFNPDLHLLGLELAANGFAGRELAIGALARAARQARLNPVLTDVLVSESEPEPARLRAFARIVAALGRHPAEPSGETPTVSRAA